MPGSRPVPAHRLLTSCAAVFLLHTPQATALAETDPLAQYFDETELVEVATHAAKPITQVAENVTIITSAEIEAMYAHSLTEVLSRISGVSVDAMPQGYNGTNVTLIQSSRGEQVLILLDGVRLNSAMSGDASLSHIPLPIIERIEIIKGPASASWGSSQGGVINILTKKTGDSVMPSGSVRGEVGEKNTASYEADLTGKVDRVGYYLYAGKQDSDGLLDERFYNSGRAYGKVQIDMPAQGVLTFSGNAIDPHYREGDFDYATPYFDSSTRDRTYFLTANYDSPLSDSLHLNVGARRYERNFLSVRDILASSPEGIPGSLFWQTDWHEKSQGTNGLLTWSGEWQQVACGFEFNRNEMGSTTDYGAWTQENWGAPAQDESQPGFEEVWGIFLNDTLRFGRFTVIPGIRYDDHSISNSMLSPSLGATYLLRPDTLLRATAARGFQYPILSYIAGGGIWDNPNSALKPEKVSSVQAGVENRSLSCASIKAAAFFHHVTDAWVYDGEEWNYKNGGSEERKGVEGEIESISWHNLSLVANATYTLLTPEDTESDDTSSTATNLIFRYRETQGWNGELAGQYIWWNREQLDGCEQTADLIWSFSVGRTLFHSQALSCELYAKVYNLFDGAAHSSSYYPLPGRWFLAGLRMKF